MSQLSVVIVDDHILIAKAIAGMIDSFPRFKVLYEVEHGKALMERFAQKRNIPDIVLLDISMPVMDGFATAEWLKNEHPEVLVMALSMQDDDRSLIRMIKAGAKGYLLKNIQPEGLDQALTQLWEKGMYFPDWAAGKVFLNLASNRKEDPAKAPFTEKEEQFLTYCCTELSYREIAEQMFVSPRTVEGYRDSLFEKLGLRTRVGLAMFAIKSGRGGN